MSIKAHPGAVNYGQPHSRSFHVDVGECLSTRIPEAQIVPKTDLNVPICEILAKNMSPFKHAAGEYTERFNSVEAKLPDQLANLFDTRIPGDDFLNTLRLDELKGMNLPDSALAFVLSGIADGDSTIEFSKVEMKRAGAMLHALHVRRTAEKFQREEKEFSRLSKLSHEERLNAFAKEFAIFCNFRLTRQLCKMGEASLKYYEEALILRDDAESRFNVSLAAVLANSNESEREEVYQLFLLAGKEQLVLSQKHGKKSIAKIWPSGCSQTILEEEVARGNGIFARCDEATKTWAKEKSKAVVVDLAPFQKTRFAFLTPSTPSLATNDS